MKQLLWLAFFATSIYWPVQAQYAQSIDVNVKDFGATGDGVTDDQAALSRAFGAAPAGSTVVIPPGVYLHSDLLLVTTSIHIKGYGPASVLEATNPQRSALDLSFVTDCAVENLNIKGVSATRLSTNESVGVLLDHVTGCSVFMVHVEGGSSAGILANGSSNLDIHNNIIQDTLADGIHITGGSRDVSVRQNVATNTGDDSFAAVAYAHDPQTANVTIEENVSINSHARGATCIGAQDCVIKANRIVNPRSHGIAVAYESIFHTWHPENAIVSENLVTSVTGAAYNAILIDKARKVTLTNNEIAFSRPILVRNSTDVQLLNNNIHDMDGPAILVLGSNVLSIQNNRVATASGPGLIIQNSSMGSIVSNTLDRVAQLTGAGAIDLNGSFNLQIAGNTILNNILWRKQVSLTNCQDVTVSPE